MKYLSLWGAIWAAHTKTRMFVIREEKGEYECKSGLIEVNKPQFDMILNYGTVITKEEFESKLRTDCLKNILFKALYQNTLDPEETTLSFNHDTANHLLKVKIK